MLIDALSVHQYRDSILSKLTRDIDNGWAVFDGTQAFVELNSNNYNEKEYYNDVSSHFGYMCDEDLTKFFFPNGCRETNAIHGSIIYGHELDKKIDGKIWKPKVERRVFI